MFDINSSYWLKVKSDMGDRVFSIKVKVLEENGYMIKAVVSHGDKPDTTDIIPLSRIVGVQGPLVP